MRIWLTAYVVLIAVKMTSSAVSWVLDTSITNLYEPRFTKSVRLNCTVTGSICCPPSATYEWWVNKGAGFNIATANGATADSSKYEEEIDASTNQMNLIIKDFDEDDVNIDYRCVFDFDDQSKKLQMGDGLHYIPTDSDIFEIMRDFSQETMFSYSVNVTGVYPDPSCSCSYGNSDLSSFMTTTPGNNGALKYAVLSLQNVSHVCSGKFKIKCTVGLYPDEEIIDFIPCKTLSTHSVSSLDVNQSTLPVPTDGGIHSLNTLSNSPDETMTFSSIFLAITETSSIFQPSATSDISPYYISNSYTPTYLMSTLTTNIFGNSISLPFSTSGAFLHHNSETSLKSIFDTMTSDLSIFSAKNDLHSSFSTINALESLNFISLSKIYRVDSITGMTFTIGNRISSIINSGYMSGLKSLTFIALSDSLTQDLLSQIATSPYGIVSTQKETGSHIDHTPLTSFTYANNLQLSSDISYQTTLSPSYSSHLAGISTQTLLTIPKTLSNLDTNSILLTTFTPDETSTFSLSTKYINSVDFKSLFDFDSNTKNDTIGTSMSKIIETLTLNSIAEIHETKSAKISMNNDLSSNLLKNSPITSFGNMPGTMIVRPSMVEITTSMDSFFETFDDKASTHSVNSLQTRSLNGRETVGIIMSTPVEPSNENTDTLFESSSISPSTSFNHMQESSSLHTDIEADSVYNATSSADSVLLDSFSMLTEKDSDNVLSTTSDVVVWSRNVSRLSFESLSPIGSPYGSTALISTKYMLSISVNPDKYSSAHLKDFVSTLLPSVSTNFYFSDINTASSLLVSTPIYEHSVITNSPSLTKSTKVIAISVTVVGCILFVAITILVLFVLKLLQCKSLSNVSKTNKKFSNTDSKSLSISKGGRLGTSLFDKPYGLPTSYYDKTATSWGVNDNQFTCSYNKNWDDIT